jgi:hypothetical protein
MVTYDPWVLGFVFLLGVIVGHYFSTLRTEEGTYGILVTRCSERLLSS